jgi:hypothetical protein
MAKQSTVEQYRHAKLLPPVTTDELRAECRAKEDALLDYELATDAIAKALWPEGSEAPESYRRFGEYEASELVDGIVSLHELTDRLMAENERLRRERGVS